MSSNLYQTYTDQYSTKNTGPAQVSDVLITSTPTEVPYSAQTAEWFLIPCTPVKKRLNSICIDRLVGRKICLQRPIMGNSSIGSPLQTLVSLQRTCPSTTQGKCTVYCSSSATYWIGLFSGKRSYTTMLLSTFLKLVMSQKFPQFICFVVKICVHGSWGIMYETHRNDKQEWTGNYKSTTWALAEIFTGLLLTTYEAFITAVGAPHLPSHPRN